MSVVVTPDISTYAVGVPVVLTATGISGDVFWDLRQGAGTFSARSGNQITFTPTSIAVHAIIRASSTPWEGKSIGDVVSGMTLLFDGNWKATSGTNSAWTATAAARTNNNGDYCRFVSPVTGLVNIFPYYNNIFGGPFSNAPDVGRYVRFYIYNAAAHQIANQYGTYTGSGAGTVDTVDAGSGIGSSWDAPGKFDLTLNTDLALNGIIQRPEVGNDNWAGISGNVFGITGYNEGIVELSAVAPTWHKVKIGSGSVAGWEDERDVTGGTSGSVGTLTVSDPSAFFPDGLFVTGRRRSGDISFTGIPTGTANAWLHIKMAMMDNSGNPNLTCLAYAGSTQIFDANFAYITGIVKVVDVYVKRDGSGVAPIPKVTGTNAILCAIAYKDEDPPTQTIDAEVLVIIDSIHKIWQGSTDDLQPHPGMAERIATAIGGNYFNYRSCADFNPARNINVYNIGHEGRTLQDMDTEIAAHLGDLYKSGKLQIVVLTGGANNHTESDATVYGRMLTNKASVLAQGANYKPVIASPIPYGELGGSLYMMAGVATLINTNAISDGFFRKADVNSDPIWTATPKSVVWRNTEYPSQVNDISVHINQPGEAKATQIVLNSFIADLPVTLPTLTTATVENANKNKIVLTYDRSLDTGSVPATGDFAVSGGKTVTNVAVSGTTVTLTVNSNYAFGDTITASYTPAANPIKDASLGLSALGLSSQSVTNNIANPDVTAPVLSSATVENSNKNKIVLTYGETLDSGSVPATSDFAVSGGKTVTNVAIVGSVVTLTVNANYAFGDTITASYTPGVNKIRDAAHNNSVALSSQAVTNNIANPDTTPPALSTATVENANKNKIVMTYDENLDSGSVPATGDFSVSAGKTVTGVAIVGAVLTLTVNSNYAFGDTITVSYVPGTNKIRDAAHNNSVALTNRAVTNNINNPDATPPVLSTATVENANKNKIILTYNESLDSGSVPATGDFTVSGGKTVTNVDITGGFVTLTVSANYAFGDVISVSYTPGSNPVRDVAHNNAASLSSQAVSNNIDAVDVTAPTLSSAVVQNANRNKVVLIYNESLDTGSVPANGDFSVSGGKSVTGVSIVGTTVTLTLDANYAEGDTITVSYTGGVNKIQDIAGNDAGNLSNHSVTNNISATPDTLADFMPGLTNPFFATCYDLPVSVYPTPRFTAELDSTIHLPNDSIVVIELKTVAHAQAGEYEVVTYSPRSTRPTYEPADNIVQIVAVERQNDGIIGLHGLINGHA